MLTIFVRAENATYKVTAQNLHVSSKIQAEALIRKIASAILHENTPSERFEICFRKEQAFLKVDGKEQQISINAPEALPLFQKLIKKESIPYQNLSIPPLRNQGNSCYAAATTQMLAQDPILCNAFCQELPANHPFRQFLQEYTAHVLCGGTSLSLSAVQRAYETWRKERRYSQQDPHEFLSFLFALFPDTSSLHVKVTESWYYLDEQQCRQLGNTPAIRKELPILQVQMPKEPQAEDAFAQSIDASLRDCSPNHALRKDSRGVSRKPVELTKWYVAPPSVLLLHIQRGIFSSQGTFDLRPISIPYSLSAQDQHYELQSAVIYTGNGKSGHYTTLLKKTGPTGEKIYTRCNDSTISEITEDQFKSLLQQAHLLNYHRVDVPRLTFESAPSENSKPI